MYSNDTSPVLGIGTVLIPTKKTPHGSGRGTHTQLVLRDVLHIPSGHCNIIGLTDDFEGLSIILGGAKSSKSRGAIKNMQGQPLAYFDASKTLFVVKLSGPPVGPIVGPSAFSEPDIMHLVNVQWAPAELARWKEYKQDNESRISRATEPSSVLLRKNTVRKPQPGLGYTKEEKAWLKVHYGNEWRFLTAHGLSMFDDVEREEGREIVRGFMAELGPLGRALVQAGMEEEVELPEVEDVEDDDSNEGENPAEDLDGHMVDYLFNERSLRWMEKHYRTSMNFMYSNGLKFYDQDDCQVAQRLVEDYMRES